LDEIAQLEKNLSQTLSLSSLTLKNTSRDESTTTKAVTLFLSLSLYSSSSLASLPSLPSSSKIHQKRVTGRVFFPKKKVCF
jgi:hypothetical protein